MKILVFSDTFGGHTTTFIYNEVSGLAKTEEVKYLCLDRVNADIFPFRDVRIVSYRVNAMTRKARWLLEKNDLLLTFTSRSFASQIRSIVDDWSPDLIHCHFGYEALRFTDNFADHSIPLIVSFHGHDASFFLKRSSYVRKLKGLFARPNTYATMCATYLERRLAESGVRFNKRLVLYYGIRTDIFRRASRQKTTGSFTFLQVSNFQTRKGHHVTLSAFKALLTTRPQLECRLVLAGDGPEFEGVRSLAKSLGIEEHVDFTGWVSPAGAKALMDEADCFVHHSLTVDGWTEGIPNAIIEAMAMELPVVSTRHAGIPELVRDGVDGFLVEENDVQAYAQRMADVLSWGYLSESRRRVEELFEFEQHMNQLQEFYADVMAGDAKTIRKR